MTQIIDGKQISAEIKDELKEQVAVYRAQGKEICLAVIQVYGTVYARYRFRFQDRNLRLCGRRYRLPRR